MYLCVPFSDCVESDGSNHLIVLHLFKHISMAFCGDAWFKKKSDEKEYWIFKKNLADR